MINEVLFCGGTALDHTSEGKIESGFFDVDVIVIFDCLKIESDVIDFFALFRHRWFRTCVAYLDQRVDGLV